MKACANGALLFAAALLVSLVHGVRAGWCDVLSGLENLALGPGVGAVLGGVWGFVVSELTRRVSRRWLERILVVVLAIAGPLGSALFSVARFYGSPMIFAYDPFVGYFSGSLYDTVVDLSGLVSYRLGSAATLFAAFVGALHLVRNAGGHLRYQSIGRPGLLATGVLSALGSVGLTLSGPKLGHYHSRDTIAEALGAALSGERCEVIYPRFLPLASAQRLERECEAHVAANEAWLGVHGTPRITVFLFRDEDQKAQFTGAGGTSIAKPWRHEVYVQMQGYPHKVLGHELMHVVAGDAARGPFHVAAAFSGWLPNPGLIEGVAVASNPRDDDLSAAEWAKAMKDLGILPPLSRLFALGFFGENSATAYTVSGAFVGFVHDEFGPDAVRRWYGGEDLPAVVGKGWPELEQAWHAELDALVLPNAAKEQAKARFDRPGIFKRRCPRTVDACKERGHALASGGDAKGAILELERALTLDPESEGLRLDIAELYAPAGDPAKSEAELGAIVANEKTPRTIRDQALESLADMELARGDADAAAKKYDELVLRVFEESHLRTLYVKAYAAKDPRARDALTTLLVGRAGKKPDRVQASEMLAVLDQRFPENGLFAYLMARYDVDQEDYETAERRLASALARQLDVPHVRVEAMRLRVIVACARGDFDAAKAQLVEYAKHPDAQRARVEVLKKLVERSSASVVALPAKPAPGAPSGSASATPP
jgi:tetratricopeptide (TPR) repeat protein